MKIRNEYVAREWILRHLGHTIGTTNIDKIIIFARNAGYLDADGTLTVAGRRYYVTANRDPAALRHDKNYAMQHVN